MKYNVPPQGPNWIFEDRRRWSEATVAGKISFICVQHCDVTRFRRVSGEMYTLHHILR